MVRPNELVEAVLYTLQQSAGLPDETNFVGYEPDINSESIKLPLIEVTPETQVEVSESNTDFIGYRYDDNGNEFGKIFESLYTLEITISAWTAHGSRFSPRDISDTIRDKLYAHETGGPEKPLRHPDDDRELDEVWRFDILSGDQTDDLGTSPTLRRWEQSIEIAASERYLTNSPNATIESIDFNDTVTETNDTIEVSSGDTQ